MLPHIISQNQSAFIHGRLIINNFLVAFETLYTMDPRMKGRGGFMALKLDMGKAYDRVDGNSWRQPCERLDLQSDGYK